MKKIFFLINIICVLLISVNVIYAKTNVTYEINDMPNNKYFGNPLIYNDNKKPVSYEINNNYYLWTPYQTTCHALKYSDTAYNSLSTPFQNTIEYNSDVIWTGEYYMVRNARNDEENSGYWQFIKVPIKFYDKDFNLVREQKFDGYPYQIEYYNNTYYCKYYGSGEQRYDAVAHIMSSTDTINWTDVTDSEKIMPQKIGNTICKYNLAITKGEVIIGDGKLYDVVNEYGEYSVLGARFGNYTCGIGPKTISFSNDGIYSYRIVLEDSFPVEDSSDLDIYYIYEYDDDIVIDTKKLRIRTPKQEVYNQLDTMKKSPYVCLNNKILRFEQPPVIQDDYTLVPIRFLFEQMGADVTWNQDTQTATITQDNKAITFGIDDTDASVNGSTVSMDVPARLINDKTMVPVRFLSEELGYTVDWDGDNRIITIE